MEPHTVDRVNQAVWALAPHLDEVGFRVTRVASSTEAGRLCIYYEGGDIPATLIDVVAKITEVAVDFAYGGAVAIALFTGDIEAASRSVVRIETLLAHRDLEAGGQARMVR